jgi:NDP-sugar pyrophosphorylase family protein
VIVRREPPDVARTNGKLYGELKADEHRNGEASLANVDVVILAGGKGKRLAPYTSVLPKPLMPIGERAILEVVVEQLADSGFQNVTLCVGYLAHLIQAVFNNGSGRRVSMRYVREKDPLGTAGPLRLVEGLEGTFLVMNGDVLTTLPYDALVREHRASGNVLTIAAHRRTTKIDYGVLHLDGAQEKISQVTAYEEKPEFGWTVSMGIYVMEPEALDYIPPGGYFDFPDLVQALLRADRPVGAYVYDGFWLDIGREEDYQQAVELWESAEAVQKNGKKLLASADTIE